MGRKGGAENWVDLRYEPVSDQAKRDEAAFALIAKSVEAWEKAEKSNKYPFDREGYTPNFEEREFVDLKISGWNFIGHARNTKFKKCYFENCDFSYAHLEGCLFESVVATDTSFAGAYFDNTFVRTCSFEYCDFEDVSWLDGDVKQVSFRGSNFTEAVFGGSLFHEVSFHEAYGRIVSFDDARMFEISWLGARFSESSFERTDMPRQPIYMGETSFIARPDGEDDWDEFEIEGADFSNSWFQDAELANLNFAASNLSNTTFFWCNLSGANLRRVTGLWAGAFRGADLAGAQLPPEISFDNIIKKIELAVSLARPAYLTNLVTCAAVILAVIVASATPTVTLPLFGIPVDSKAFGLYGLIQSALISLYVGIYLIRIWEGTAELPAIHPNGISTPDLISPWTVIAPTWFYLRVKSGKKRLRLPKGYNWQFSMAILSHWLITPITSAMLAFEFRNNSAGTSLLCFGIGIVSLGINGWLYREGTSVLKGKFR